MKSLLASRKFHIILSVSISTGLLVWLGAVIDWQEVWQQLIRTRYELLIPMTVVFAAHNFTRAYRWRFFLKGEPPPINELFDALMLGNFASYILPLRAGEFVRPFVLAKRNDRSFAHAFSSIVIERFFDLSLVLLFFGLMVLRIESIPGFVHKGAAALFAVALFILLFIVAGSFFPNKVKGIFQFLIKPLPEKVSGPVNGFVSDLLHSTEVLHDFKNLFRVVLFSFVAWGLCFYYFDLALLMVGLEGGYWTGISIAVMIALAVAAPSAPGFIGVYQGGCIAAFLLFGYSKETAVTYSIVTHLHQYLLVIGYGIFCLFKYQLSVRRLQEMGV